MDLIKKSEVIEVEGPDMDDRLKAVQNHQPKSISDKIQEKIRASSPFKNQKIEDIKASEEEEQISILNLC